MTVIERTHRTVPVMAALYLLGVAEIFPRFVVQIEFSAVESRLPHANGGLYKDPLTRYDSSR